MPNPGAFQGSRKEFLVGKKADFARSVRLGYSTEMLSTIQREYFKRYPVDLPHNEEPSAEHLAAVDDDAPDPEIEEPDKKTMGVEEYQEAMARIEERKLLVTKRRAQIKRWFIYQFMKDNNTDPRDQRARSPYQAYLVKIRGGERDRPRRKSAVNVWRKFHRERIDGLSKLTADRENIPKSGMAHLRDKIAHDLFEALPKSEQKEWTNISLDEHKQVLEEWEQDRHRPVSTNPEDHQLAIQGLVRFVQPVLDVIADSTGWKVSLFAGGPEPAQEGMLNVISVHSGTTPGDIKLSFGQSERASIKKDFIPSFGAFLRKCYTPEECRARALSDLEGFVPISDMEMEGGDAMVHSLADIGDDSNTPAPEPSVPSAATNESASNAVPPPVQSDVVQAVSNVVSAPASAPAQPNVVSTPTLAPAPSVVPARSDIASAATKGQPDVASTASTSVPTQSNGSNIAPSPVATNAIPPLSSTPAVPLKAVAAASSAARSSESEDSEEEDNPFAVSYRLRSESPPSFSCLLPSPSRSRHASLAPSLPPSPKVTAEKIPAVPLNLPPSSEPLIPSSTAPGSELSSTAPASEPLIPSSTTPACQPVMPSSTAPASEPLMPSPSLVTTLASVSKPSARITKKKAPIVMPQEDVDVRRPRRDVKKTAKAICLEEELAKKGLRGKKRSLEVGGEESSSETVRPKRSRGVPQKKGRRE